MVTRDDDGKNSIHAMNLLKFLPDKHSFISLIVIFSCHLSPDFLILPLKRNGVSGDGGAGDERTH